MWERTVRQRRLLFSLFTQAAQSLHRGHTPSYKCAFSYSNQYVCADIYVIIDDVNVASITRSCFSGAFWVTIGHQYRSSHVSSSVSTGRFLQTQIQSCRSQRIWALPSFTPSRCMLPWRTLCLSTCACWTSTLNPLCLVTPASSAQSVRLNRDKDCSHCILRTSYLNRVLIHLSRCRTCLQICGNGQGNDQGWDEHCKNELLSRHPRGGSRMRNIQQI